MKRLEVSGVVRPIYGSLGVKQLNTFKNDYIGCSLLLCGRMFKFAYVVKICL